MTRFRTLRRRMALALGGVVLLILALVLGVGRLVLTHGFGTLEQGQARDRAALAVQQLQDEQQRITELAYDYAAWDDMYAFAAAPEKAFIESAIPPDWLERVRLDLMAVLDTRGQLLFAKTNTNGVIEAGVPPQLLNHLRAGAPMVTHAGPKASHTGLLVFAGTPWIVASRPIVTSATAGPIRGTFLLARRVDAGLLARFSTAIGLPINLTSRRIDGIAVGEDYEMQLTSDDYLTAAAPVHDVFGASLGWMTVRVPRGIDAQSRVTQYYLLTSLLIATLVLITVALFLLDRFIVGRVAVLARFLREVESHGDLSARVEDAHADEIGHVAGAVNNLLVTLEHRNREIEEARAQAFAALEESARKNQELEQANLTIARLAGTDDLTGLANRRLFDSRLDEQIAKGIRVGESFAVILTDIDHFKSVNDTYGHQTGDRVLVHVASSIAAHTRGYDLAARHGGEEFAVLLPGIGLDECADVAERIRRDIEQLAVPGYDRPVTVSLGVAEWRAGDTALQLMRRADEGLYLAKRGGRNRVEAVKAEAVADANQPLAWRPRAVNSSLA